MVLGPAGYKNNEAYAVQAQMYIIDDHYKLSSQFEHLLMQFLLC